MNFSIIIPAKNEAANIGRCLDSIANVEWDRYQYEVIVVDNGSSDSTVAIAQEKGAQVFVKPELTISGLRNFGAGNASGKILAFIDSDCTVTPAWLEKASHYLSRTEVACFGSPPIVPNDATWVQKAWFEVRKKKVDVGETDWLESMNMFVRHDVFTVLGGFDESLITCEDYDLTLRLKQHGSLMCDSSIVAIHHGEAATVGHFFFKELWRGKSNFAGMMQHGITKAEFPSLVVPTLHCLFALSLIGCVVAFALIGGFFLYFAVAIIALWQTPLVILAYRKHRSMSPVVLQLSLLLNVYFFARGLAVFKFK